MQDGITSDSSDNDYDSVLNDFRSMMQSSSIWNDCSKDPLIPSISSGSHGEDRGPQHLMCDSLSGCISRSEMLSGSPYPLKA